MQKEHDKLWLPTPHPDAQISYSEWILKKK